MSKRRMREGKITSKREDAGGGTHIMLEKVGTLSTLICAGGKAFHNLPFA